MGQLLCRQAPGFVDFTHGHHDPVIHFQNQLAQGELGGSQPVNLFPDCGFVQGVFPGLFHNKFRLAIALVAVLIGHGHDHGLAQMGGDQYAYRQPVLVVRAKELGSVLHQFVIIGPKHPVV